MTAYARPGDIRDFTLEDAPTGLVGDLGLRIEDLQANIVVLRSTNNISQTGPARYVKAKSAVPSQPGQFKVIWDAPNSFPGLEATEDLEIITVLSDPTASAGGRIKVTRGDDYLALDGRAFLWKDSRGFWPSLNGATVEMQLTKTSIVYPMTVISEDITQLELTSEQTLALEVKTYQFVIRATLEDASTVTLRSGTMIVQNI